MVDPNITRCMFKLNGIIVALLKNKVGNNDIRYAVNVKAFIVDSNVPVSSVDRHVAWHCNWGLQMDVPIYFETNPCRLRDLLEAIS